MWDFELQSEELSCHLWLPEVLEARVGFFFVLGGDDNGFLINVFLNKYCVGAWGWPKSGHSILHARFHFK